MIKQRNFWVFLLLNLITCGFYGIYFWYVWNKDVNCICEGDGHDMPNYIVVLLLGLVTVFRRMRRDMEFGSRKTETPFYCGHY